MKKRVVLSAKRRPFFERRPDETVEQWGRRVEIERLIYGTVVVKEPKLPPEGV